MRHRLKIPQNQPWMPGALEAATVIGIAASWIGHVFSIIRPTGGKQPTRRLSLCAARWRVSAVASVIPLAKSWKGAGVALSGSIF